jgi:hypothetical protein
LTLSPIDGNLNDRWLERKDEKAVSAGNKPDMRAATKYGVNWVSPISGDDTGMEAK